MDKSNRDRKMEAIEAKLAYEYIYEPKFDSELHRIDEQLFPDGKKLNLKFKFGPRIVRIPLVTKIYDSDRTRADMTLNADNFEMLGLYHSILDEGKTTKFSKERKWICKELPELRELTINWNGVLIVIISRSKEESEDLDELLSTETAHKYTSKWKMMNVPKQSIKKLTLVLDPPMELKREYELRYVIPAENEKLFDLYIVDMEKVQKYIDQHKEKERKIGEIRESLSRININKEK